MNWIDAIGTPVKLNHWHGVLQDVFVSPVTGNTLVKVLYAKNVFKRQGAEITPVTLIEASTWKALDDQIQHYRDQLEAAMEELRE